MSRQIRLTRTYLLLAPVAPLAFAGWLAWQAMDGDGDDQNGKSAATSSASASPPSASASPEIDSKPLEGKVVVLDPGHNPNNVKHPDEINRKVGIGTNRKECDTTGTATSDGRYSEAEFTLDLARRTRDLLRAQGAEVKLTQNGRRAYGPCIDERAAIGNRAEADAVVSIHADGGGPGDRGFHVILPERVTAGKADTTRIAGPSRQLGEELKAHFAEKTGSDASNYVGNATGFTVRGDLGGLNLSTVPKVFIECGNMRDAEDAARLRDAAWRQRAAHGITDGITAFLRG